MSSELSTGRTIVILAVVVGCFAVLWPKVFYPMLTSSVRNSQAPSFRDPANAHFYKQLCHLLSEAQATSDTYTRLSEGKCLEEVRKNCRVKLTEAIIDSFRQSNDKTNLTRCLNHFHLDATKISMAAPAVAESRPYKATTPHPHARPQRQVHHPPDAMHPALREKGIPIPHRTIEKQARPGPMPGIRPPMGGGGHMSAPQTKGSGAMGIIMPIYTVGIIIFFVYTIMKVLFKKDCDEEKTPKLKDFHLDPEYRKYVFDEEYLDNSTLSHRDHIGRNERDPSKHRRRIEPTFTDPKIEDEQMDQLRRRLEETESAMERLMSQMGSVTDKLTAAKITEVLSQAQAQARILKDDDDASEADAPTISEDFSLPLNLQRRLEELNIKDIYMKGTFVDLDDENIPRENTVYNINVTDVENYINEIGSMADKLDCNEIENTIPLENTINDNICNNHEELVDVNKLKGNLDQGFNVIDKMVPIENTNKSIICNNQEELINVNKLKGNLDQDSNAGPSDIAQIDSDDGLSDENMSGASATGADISELKSYADEGVISEEADLPPQIVEEIVPEANYVAPKDDLIVPLEVTPTDVNISCLRPTSPPAIEQGTQTESAKKMSVMDLQTTYLLKEQVLQDIHPQRDNISNINEIILDATLPFDTQLLIKDSQLVSSENLLDSDSSETNLSPFIVTSQVHLAFVGLEQTGSLDVPRYIIPEKRELPLVTKDTTCVPENFPVNNTDMANQCEQIISKPPKFCDKNGIDLANMNNFSNTLATSFHQESSQKSPKISTNSSKSNIIIEETAKKIVEEATEECLRRLHSSKSSDALCLDHLHSKNTIEDIRKSNAEKVSSSKTSSADLEDYEILPKSGEMCEENSVFLRDEDSDQTATKITDRSS